MFGVQTAAALLISVLVIVIVYTILFVMHPRAWWTHCSFDVDGYLEDDLLPTVQACGAAIVACTTPAVPGRVSYSAATSGSGELVFTKMDGVNVLSTPAFITQKFATVVPGLASLGEADYSAPSYTVDTLGTQLIDYDSPTSVMNAPSSGTFNKVIAQIAMLNGNNPVSSMLLAGGASLCLAIDQTNFVALQQGQAVPYLTQIFNNSTIDADDPFVALLGQCLQGDVQTGWDTFSNELKVVLAACTAIADLRHLYLVVGPQVRKMRMNRRPTTNLVKVFQLFNSAYLVEYKANASESFAEYEADKGSAWNEASVIVDWVISEADTLLGDKKHTTTAAAAPSTAAQESFSPYVRSTLFGVHVDETGREVVVEEMSIGTLFSAIGSLLKIFPEMIKGVTDIVKTAIVIVKALVGALDQLKNGPVAFITAIFKVIIGGIVLIVLTIAKPWIHFIIFFWIGVVPLLIKLAFFTAIFLVACVSNLVLSFADISTGGMLQFLSRSEDHPEAHWNQAGVQSGNVSERIFGTLYRCSEGFEPGFAGFSCVRVSRCVPLASPSAMLIRQYRESRYVPLLGGANLYMHPLLPDTSVKCTKAVGRYTKANAKTIRTNGFTVDQNVVRDLVSCVCAQRMHMAATAGNPQQVCAMCEAALPGTSFNYGGAIVPPSAAAPQMHPLIVVAGSAVAAAVVIAAMGMARDLNAGPDNDINRFSISKSACGSVNIFMMYGNAATKSGPTAAETAS